MITKFCNKLNIDTQSFCIGLQLGFIFGCLIIFMICCLGIRFHII